MAEVVVVVKVLRAPVVLAEVQYTEEVEAVKVVVETLVTILHQHYQVVHQVVMSEVMVVPLVQQITHQHRVVQGQMETLLNADKAVVVVVAPQMVQGSQTQT